MSDTAKLAAVILPDDEVCACLSETGERKIRLYERCQRCGAFMEADYLSDELHSQQLAQALLGVRDFNMPDGSPCYCPEWQRETFREDVPEDYQHHPACAAALAALAAAVTGEDA